MIWRIVTYFGGCCKCIRGADPSRTAVQRELFCLTGNRVFLNIRLVASADNKSGDEGWNFGDEWKKGSPDDQEPLENVRYADILRGDTGKGYDDSLMLDLVGYLGSVGIRATYESFSLGMEPAAIKTYVLKVEEGKEEEAIRLLEEKNK